jgi:hypothetical protein
MLLRAVSNVLRHVCTSCGGALPSYHHAFKRWKAFTGQDAFTTLLGQWRKLEARAIVAFTWSCIGSHGSELGLQATPVVESANHCRFCILTPPARSDCSVHTEQMFMQNLPSSMFTTTRT